MKIEPRKFAPLGLYLSMLASLAAVGLYIVQRQWNLPLQISLGLVVAGLAVFGLLDPNRVREILTGRQAKYGSNAIVMGLAFFGILAVINYLAFKNPQRWDLTENQQYTLAPETLDTLKSLPQPVKVMAFYTVRLPTQRAQGLLDQFKFHSKGAFDYEFIDPDSNPTLAQQANVTRDGTLVLQMGDNQELVTFVDEREITGALVRLINPGKRVVYFLTGHGEYNPTESGEQGYNQARVTLEKKNYEVKTLNLLAEKKIPEDASVIVIAGPDEIPVSEGEVAQLGAFLDNGGGLIVMAEPSALTKFYGEADPLADYLAKSWGAVLGEDLVVDLTPDLFGNMRLFNTVAASYGKHAITDKMQGVAAELPTARSVTAITGESGIIPTQLVLTADQSWAETDLASMMNAKPGETPSIKPDQGVDLIGPVSLAVAAENITTHGRLAAFGDSDFAADTYFKQYGNGDLFINSVDWASEQENLINLTPKDNTPRVLVSPTQYTMNLILLGSVFVLPGIVLVSGIIVWIQRRRRG